MTVDYYRRCPSCGTENKPQVMRCACGALLAGVDLLNRQPLSEATVSAVEPAPPQAGVTTQTPASAAICAFEDCGQSNPTGSKTCLYCNRPLTQVAGAGDQLQSLISLPGKLKDQYRILRPLTTSGAEAELLLVQSLTGEPAIVAKIYRHGVHPKAEVLQRMARVDPKYCVRVLETGTAQGYAYELMEYCESGSLRDLLRSGPMAGDPLREVVRQVTGAIVAVHAAGLLHRDLKPANILVRALQPLELVLTDFGISSVIEATQRFTGTARTLPYASPESLSGVIDIKADYWALGIIILESILGKHPFAGLSEPVVLHHLTTRGIDLAEVSDRSFKKLLRGLLIRDPKNRWSANEIARWLANDPSLAEPLEQGAAHSFEQPYRLGQEVCYSPEQLAVALSRNWAEGVADIGNGLLLTWFREVQVDQNVVRMLIDLRHDSRMPVDLQLLQLILQLAPGIPPVWRGEPLGLRVVLMHANDALNGDVDAAHWLHQLHQYRVLQAYAKAGNEECADIVQRWSDAADLFDGAWEYGLARIKSTAHATNSPAQAYPDVHQLLYGKSDPDRPALANMHARLLAVAYDSVWAQRLRSRLTADLTTLTVHCPWLLDLGDPQTLAAADLLVLESLLPEARRVADRQLEADARALEAQADECKAMSNEYQNVLVQIQSAGRASLIAPAGCSDLAACVEHYFDLVARIVASGRSDLPWQQMTKSVARAKPVISQLRERVEKLIERRAQNVGWLSREVAIFVVAALLLLPILLHGLFPSLANAPIGYLMSAGILAIGAWRLLPMVFLTREIRELVAKLSTWTRPVVTPASKVHGSARNGQK